MVQYSFTSTKTRRLVVRTNSPGRPPRLSHTHTHTLQIFRHRPIIIYTRLPAGGTKYPMCMFPTNRECLIGISDAFSAFCLRRVFVTFPTCSLYPQQKRAYSALPVGTYRVQSPGFPKIVYYLQYSHYSGRRRNWRCCKRMLGVGEVCYTSSPEADAVRAQEVCESRGGRPGLPVPNSPYGLCGRKATLNL